MLQELYAKVVADEKWLWEVLKDCIGGENADRWSDGIVSGLWKVHEAVRDDADGKGYVQDLELGLCRGDWMLGIDKLEKENEQHEPEDCYPGSGRRKLKRKPTLKQVELNTIATAGVSHSNVVSDMHHHLLRTGIYHPYNHTAPKGSAKGDRPSDFPSESTALPSLHPNQTLAPHNNGIAGFAKALTKAHHLYGRPRSQEASKTAVLMVVQHDNVNIADERPIEYALWDMGVPCFRCEYREVLQRTWFASDAAATGRELLFSPFKPSPSHPSFHLPSSRPLPPNQVYEVSVVYLRSSLDISELSPGPGLGTRLHLERARAIKCPSVLGQLAACKLVQQHLSQLGVMERHIGGEKARTVRDRCMKMEGLDDETSRLRKLLDGCVAAPSQDIGPKRHEDTKEANSLGDARTRRHAAEKALAKYVLKPIGAEGGGHCIFGSAIPRFYAEHIPPEGSQAGYVLMERIQPPVVRGALISQRGYYVGNVVSELGILGSVLWMRNRNKHKDGHNVEPNAGRRKDETQVEIISNEALGWTLKSKGEDVPEMSVIKGYGCFDTPCLVDWDTYLERATEGIDPGSKEDKVGGD